MKIITLLTVFAFALSSTFAQEMTIKYDIEMSSDDPQLQSQLGMMEGSTLTMYAKDKKFRQEMNMGSGIMKTTTIMDSKSNKGVILMDGMMGKQASSFDLDEFKGEKNDTDLEVELVDETKEILGYTCKKAIIYTEADNELVYWYTEEIKPVQNATNAKYIQKGVPGMPLEFSITQPQMTMVFTATMVEEKVKEENVFDLTIPEGYTEKSYEEITNMSGGQ